MKFTETEWALINKDTNELYRSHWGNKRVITFFSREDAREEKRDIDESNMYRVERINVTYERIS